MDDILRLCGQTWKSRTMNDLDNILRRIFFIVSEYESNYENNIYNLDIIPYAEEVKQSKQDLENYVDRMNIRDNLKETSFYDYIDGLDMIISVVFRNNVENNKKYEKFN